MIKYQWLTQTDEASKRENGSNTQTQGEKKIEAYFLTNSSKNPQTHLTQIIVDAICCNSEPKHKKREENCRNSTVFLFVL